MSAASHCRNCDRFGDLVGGSGGGVARNSAMTSLRRASIGRQSCTHDAHLGEDVCERAHKVGARRGVAVVIDVDVNEALAPAVTLVRAHEGVELPRLRRARR